MYGGLDEKALLMPLFVGHNCTQFYCYSINKQFRFASNPLPEVDLFNVQSIRIAPNRIVNAKCEQLAEQARSMPFLMFTLDSCVLYYSHLFFALISPESRLQNVEHWLNLNGIMLLSVKAGITKF